MNWVVENFDSDDCMQFEGLITFDVCSRSVCKFFMINFTCFEGDCD